MATTTTTTKKKPSRSRRATIMERRKHEHLARTWTHLAAMAALDLSLSPQDAAMRADALLEEYRKRWDDLPY